MRRSEGARKHSKCIVRQSPNSVSRAVRSTFCARPRGYLTEKSVQAWGSQSARSKRISSMLSNTVIAIFENGRTRSRGARLTWIRRMDP